MGEPQPEDGLITQIKAADDQKLIAMLRANYGPGGNDAIQAEMTRRLMVALSASARAANKSSNVLILLTVILVALTLVLIFKN